MQSFSRKIFRRVLTPLFRQLARVSWRFLEYYPGVIPSDDLLRRWQTSEWEEYQQWIDRHSICFSEKWLQERDAAKGLRGTKISIVTPVYNTHPDHLAECVLSVRAQTAPYWELILSDDGSTYPKTAEVLGASICKDPRIRILRSGKPTGSGISAATNRALDVAEGHYVIFLDHDDRLAPEAVQRVLEALDEDPSLDILYSDRDMISPGDKRFMHLMKPDWSPENLYAGNYIFHLMCYRKEMVQQVGNLRSQFDGSQDYDLILRCMEREPKVRHLPQVLYHWRQNDVSVALNPEAKAYAFEAGMAALREALQRRGIKGEVTENPELWRGNYELQPDLPAEEEIGVITLPEGLEEADYRDFVMADPVVSDSTPYIMIVHEGVTPADNESLQKMAAWLSLQQVGLATGRVECSGRIVHAGMIFYGQGAFSLPYAGSGISEPGYMAITQAVRNISVPHPLLVMIRRELWQQLDGFSPAFNSWTALVDLAFSASRKGWRTVYVPRALFSCSEKVIPSFGLDGGEQEKLYLKWRAYIDAGDPFHPVNLDPESSTFGLAPYV